jgi:putative acetyltransferase
MNLRAATSEDQPGVEEVVAAAFDEPVDGGVVRMMRLLRSSGAERASIIAAAEDEVVGHVQLSRGWIDAREVLVEALVLSPLSVASTWQNRGIGTALVEAALVEAERQGGPAVLLEGSPTYYGRRGFQAATPKGLSRPSPRIPDRGWQVALLPAHESWMTGQVVYPDAFWVTDKVGLRDPELRQIESKAHDRE